MPPFFGSRAALIAVFGAVITLALGWHPRARVERIDTTLVDTQYRGSLTRIAVIGDFHFNSTDDFDDTRALIRDVAAAQPDAIFLVGDYIGHSSDMNTQHAAIAGVLAGLVDSAPVYAVLGNHDNGSWRELWQQVFAQTPIELVENRVIANDQFCVRGYGDLYSEQWQPTPLPDGCRDKTLTLTHDPMGLVFASGQLDTPGFAGHTHCGQIRVPWIGALIAHTDAPRAMHCGAFEIGKPGLTTGGVGTSILPLRWGPGAAPRWELVTLVNQS
ncbi:metallophosphoesterase [Litorivicinus lipolyticus]|uniref:metallophosphoesterase n=1 Tax=Litorivicinus lipolyticus TaxID=418701 RepID=UPI003B58BB71